jgi:murein DD-endopeptidase MepM/ murein hydrolase activator NlpD
MKLLSFALLAFTLFAPLPLQANSGAQWPVVDSTRDDIRSTFGPRIMSSGRYDFHRGIDIAADTGTEVTPMMEGVVYDVRVFNGMGNTVIVKHETDPVLYSYYGHLDQVLAEEGNAVGVFDVIGTIGETGSATYPHLHLEVRAGTTCSLEYQLENPESSCAGYGYDPHMHPLQYFDDIGGDQAIEFVEDNGVRARYSSNDDQPALNRIRVVIIEQDRTRNKHWLDYSARIGFDASSTDALDRQDTTSVHIDPISFGNAERFETDIVVPEYLLENAKKVIVTTWDIYGNRVKERIRL